MTISKTGDYTSPLTKTMQSSTLGNLTGDTERGTRTKEKNPPLKFVEHSLQSICWVPCDIALWGKGMSTFPFQRRKFKVSQLARGQPLARKQIFSFEFQDNF